MSESSPSELPMRVGRGLTDTVHPVANSQVTMTQLMGPQEANLLGNVFGGVVLAAVDKIAYVCATRHAGATCVTASFDQVDFRSAIQLGEVVTLEAAVNTVGRTSIEVGVRVTAETVHGKNRRHTNSCYVTMVAIDEKGKPMPVPQLELRTEAECQRYRDAEDRRAARLELADGRSRRRKARG